jgi:uncharacterized alpha-E superfamily protein
MMLSRAADNLYWMSRYLERAEHMARLVDVALDLMPDRTTKAMERAWGRIFTSLRLPLPEELTFDAYQIAHRLTFDEAEDSSILKQIAAARENARQVREQVSSEMWEQINRLFLDVRNTTIDQVWDAPHIFFQQVKQSSQLFHGVSDSTMNHGESWHFIKLGQFIERAGNVASLLRVYLGQPARTVASTSNTDQYLDWVSLLRSCTAFEAYCKVYTADPNFECITEFLLLNEEFPHAVNFSIRLMRSALNAIAEITDTRKNSQVYRRVGRLKAMLDFDQIDEVIAADLDAYLQNIQTQCAQIHNAIYRTYINYPIDEKLAA